MSLSFMQQGTQVMEEKPQVALGYYDRSKNLIDQVLKIDEKNVKALIRKCSILVEFGEKMQYTKCLKFLEEIVFQIDNSSKIYVQTNAQLKKIRDRISESPVPLAKRKGVIKPKR